MTTVADLIHQVRTDYLLTGTREQRNKLAGSVTSSDASLALDKPVNYIQPGTRLSVDFEDLYVWSISSQQASVERGQFGTTAASHSIGAMVYVNPRFSDAQILRSINDELKALSSPANGLFRIRTSDFDYSPSVEGYNLNLTDPISVYQVRYRSIGPEIDWVTIPRSQWEFIRNAPTVDFTNAYALFVRGYADSGQTIRVFYRSGFTALAASGDDIQSVSGLQAEANDVLGLGAAIRLCAGREIHRNFDEVQGETRRADEVPPGSNLQALRGLLAQYDTRRKQEASRLARLYPDRI